MYSPSQQQPTPSPYGIGAPGPCAGTAFPALPPLPQGGAGGSASGQSPMTSPPASWVSGNSGLSGGHSHSPMQSNFLHGPLPGGSAIGASCTTSASSAQLPLPLPPPPCGPGGSSVAPGHHAAVAGHAAGGHAAAGGHVAQQWHSSSPMARLR